MTPSNPERESTSRFERLSALLELDGRRAPATPGAQLETERMRLEPLPPLVLSPARRGRAREQVGWGAGLALAAGIALALAVGLDLGPFAPGDRLTIKGDASVKLFWERDGQARAWSKGVALQNGDRLLPEVLSPAPARAYWGVFDRKGALLGPGATLGEASVAVQAGKALSFANSLQLVGANEHETLVVLVCPQDVDKKSLIAMEKNAVDAIVAQTSLELSGPCKGWSFLLR